MLARTLPLRPLTLPDEGVEVVDAVDAADDAETSEGE